MYNQIKKILIIMILLPLAGMSAGKTGVDWISGTITATGTDRISVNDDGSPVDPETGRVISISSARNASWEKAKENAILEAARVIGNIQINSNERISDIVERDQVARGRITRVLHEYGRFRERPAGYMETSCELSIKTGFLITALNYDFPCDDFPLSDDTASPTQYTSLIIDVRGLGIRPMLFPSIYNESGLEIYGKNFISGDDAVKHMAVSYVHTETEAGKHKKAGQHPFFCIALKNLNGSPVLSDEDIKRVFSHKKNLAYLKKCRIIFIIDR